jgi:polyphenol oxidase
VNGIEIIEPPWPMPARVHAAFTLRTGGVSAPPFDSLNLGAHVGDAPEAVEENRRRLRQRLGLPAEPAWLQQIHGVGVADLDRDEEQRVAHAAPSVADAAVTRREDRVCVIQVADCIPVLLAARDGSAVAAAHAGWRGLAAGVLEATVLAVSGEDICAWLGPGISASHFEVGEEVRAAFVDRDRQAASAFTPNSRGRWQCDLAALARGRLLKLGVREISGGECCTYADAQRFFSYRRDGRCGRMAALIWLG